MSREFGLVPRSYWVLTREQFIEELDIELAETRKRRIAKYDRGAQKYGEDVNLFDRDFVEEERDEMTDGENYRLFDRVKNRRRELLPK